MKKFYLLFSMLLAVCAMQATVADSTLLHFGLNSYEGWTYHRSGYELDNYLIQQNKVVLMVTETGELATLESPKFNGNGMDSVKIYVDYRPQPGYSPAKVALQIDLRNTEAEVLATATQAIEPNVTKQEINLMLPVPTDGECYLLFSAPKADVANCAAVREVNVSVVTAGHIEHLLGDVTGDGSVDVSDVNAVINVMLGKNNDLQTKEWADINNDGDVDVSDVNMVINIMLGKI